MSEKIRLMVVDDNQLFRECLASRLAEQEDLTVVELDMDPRDALNKVKVHQPDIVLIAINLPNNYAFELTKQIGLELPQVKTVILGLAESEPAILECVEAGAKGYILKNASLHDLVTAIHLVYRGETACSPRIAYFMFSRVSELARERHDRHLLESLNLTAREIEILQLIADGLSNKQISQQLYLSLHTVKNHVHNILEKLRVHSRSEAVHHALREGLLRKRYPR